MTVGEIKVGAAERY